MRGEGANEQWGSTPLVHPGQERPSVAMAGTQIQAISAWVEEYVQNNRWVQDVLDEAMGESHTQDEIEGFTEAQTRAFRYTVLGRALLDVAESCFIHAAGLGED